MGQDESGTLEALKAHRRELIDPKITEYGGRIVKTTGDGLLLEFPSVVDAVRCAVDVQRGMAQRNAGVPPDQRIDFRVGINVGDIIIDGDDIYGDGVNVAARVQTLAESGGICASKVVRDQVLHKLSFTFEDLGPQQVKNISRPVEVYRVALDGTPRAAPSVLNVRRRSLPRWAFVSAGLGVLAALALSMLWWHSSRDAAAPPPAMSVAILPFTVPGGDPTDQHVADVLTSIVTTALSRDAWTRGVTHGPVTVDNRATQDLLRLGRELHVRFLVKGELHRETDKAVILVHLIDSETGIDSWTDRFEFEATQLESEQTRFARRIERRLFNGLVAAARRYAVAHPNLIDPWNAFLRASDPWERVSGSDPSAARKQLDDVLRRYPDFVPALAIAAQTTMGQLDREQADDPERMKQYYDDLDRLSGRAVMLDAEDSRAWEIRAGALGWLGRWDEALAANARAQMLDPGSVHRVVERSAILRWMGQPEAALNMIRQAQSMDPETTDAFDQRNFASGFCWCYIELGRYRDATPACEQLATSQIGSTEEKALMQAMLVAVYAQQGEMAKAATAKAAALKFEPKLSIALLKSGPTFGSQAYRDLLETHYYAGLRKAGIPEQ